VREVLAVICQAADRCAALRAAIDRDGELVDGKDGRGEICPMPFGLSDAQLHAVMLALAPLDPSKRAESPTLRAASWSKFRRY
jgi:hypothetical protein